MIAQSAIRSDEIASSCERNNVKIQIKRENTT